MSEPAERAPISVEYNVNPKQYAIMLYFPAQMGKNCPVDAGGVQ